MDQSPALDTAGRPCWLIKMRRAQAVVDAARAKSEARYSTGERNEERDDAPEADARTEVLLDGRSKECRRSVCVVKGQKAGGQNSV